MSDEALRQLERAAAQGDRQAAISWYRLQVRLGEIRRPEKSEIEILIGHQKILLYYFAASLLAPISFRTQKIEIGAYISWVSQPNRIPYGLRFSWDGARLAPLSHWPRDTYSESTEPSDTSWASILQEWIGNNRALFDSFLADYQRAVLWNEHVEYQKLLLSLQKREASLLDRVVLSLNLSSGGGELMPQLSFETDVISRRFVEEIAQKIKEISGAEIEIAYQLISDYPLWKGKKIVGDHIIYHESPTYWAQAIYHGRRDFWRKEETTVSDHIQDNNAHQREP